MSFIPSNTFCELCFNICFGLASLVGIFGGLFVYFSKKNWNLSCLVIGDSQSSFFWGFCVYTVYSNWGRRYTVHKSLAFYCHPKSHRFCASVSLTLTSAAGVLLSLLLVFCCSFKPGYNLCGKPLCATHGITPTACEHTAVVYINKRKICTSFSGCPLYCHIMFWWVASKHQC